MLLPVRLSQQDYGNATLFDSLEFQLFAVFIVSFSLLGWIGALHWGSFLINETFHDYAVDGPSGCELAVFESILGFVSVGCLVPLIKKMRWNISIVLILLSCYTGMIFGYFLSNQLFMSHICSL